MGEFVSLDYTHSFHSLTWSSNPVSQYQNRETKCESWSFSEHWTSYVGHNCSPTWNLLTPEQQHQEGPRLFLLSLALYIQCKEATATSGIVPNLQGLGKKSVMQKQLLWIILVPWSIYFIPLYSEGFIKLKSLLVSYLYMEKAHG